MDEKARTVIAKYLHDMHSLIGHGHQAIKRQREQLKDAGHPQARSAVEGFEATMDQHLAMLERRLEALGESTTSPLQDAASAVAGVAAGVYNAVRSEEASKSIRDDYTFFSHSGIAYLMLHTTSQSLGDRETADVAARGYRDMARMMMEIDRVMPPLVIQELRQDGHRAEDVSEGCRQLVHEAWRSGSAAA
jgi:ferritin-like metal-binding protein YciE